VAVLDPDPAVSRGVRRWRAPRRLWALLASGPLALGVVLLVSLASPEPARAIEINPLDPIEDLLGAGMDAVTGGIGGMAVEGLGAIIKALFAWPAKIINRELLGWLVAVPDYAIHPGTARAGGDGSNLAQLGATTSAMAFAALGAVATVSAIRYWATGLAGSGGLEALERLARTVAAALFIVLWPWLFRHAAELANEAGSGLLGSGRVLDDTARLLAVAFVAGVAFNILAILIAIGAAVLFLALLLTKVAVSATTALVFVGMPLAVMLWPVPELAWIARTAMRAFATVLAIPLLWAVCFATFAAVGIDALSLKGAGKVVDALVLPLVALALLWLTVVAPRTLARMAMLGAQGGGFVGRTASYLVARRADAAVAQTIPAALGGRAGGPGVGVAGAATMAGPAAANRARSGRLGGAASSVFGRQHSRADRQSALPDGRRGKRRRRRAAVAAGPLEATRRLRARDRARRGSAQHGAAQPVVAGDQGPRAGRACGRGGSRAIHDSRRRRSGDGVVVAGGAPGRAELDGEQGRSDPRADGTPGRPR